MNDSAKSFLAITISLCAVWVSAQNSQASAPSKSEGWITTDPESVGMSGKPLRDMGEAIRAGQFKKIGSVLVARNGNLVYEGYFDGDASTLRETRPATKSITSAVVGIAIADKKL